MLHRNPRKTLLFNRVRGSELRVVGNLVTSRERMCEALGTTRDEYIHHIAGLAERCDGELVTVDRAPVYEKRCKSLEELPVLRHFEKDAGRYITSGIVIARDEEHGRNASVHRMLVLDSKRLVIRLVERHLHEYYTRAEARGEPLEVAVVIGVHPALLFAASYPLAINQDELRLAAAILRSPLELARCRSVDLEVPANAEVVIEGRILPGERTDEGPFTDITGTYDIVRKQPVIEVTGVYRRRDAIYHALLPSSVEHRLLMGMPQEPKIFAGVAKVARVKQVALTEGGCCWLHGVVAIEKRSESDAKKAILAALEAHPSMKHVVVVDEDIDVFSAEEVEFAIATRFQADRDLVMLRAMRGSSLDPSAGKRGLTTKLGIDATKALHNLEAYERARIPER
jgi:UbiD family decarboxylase